MRQLFLTVATGALLAAPIGSFAQEQAEGPTLQDLEATGLEQVREYQGGVYRGELEGKQVYILVFDRDIDLVTPGPLAAEGGDESARALAAAETRDADDEVALNPEVAAPGMSVDGLAGDLEEQGFADVQEVSTGRFFFTLSDERTALVFSAEGLE